MVIDWHIEGEASPIHAKAGDFVLCPKFRNHHLEPVGSEMSVRIAINTRGELHRCDRPAVDRNLGEFESTED